eukprot:13149-Rhodomonas_salina.2
MVHHRIITIPAAQPGRPHCPSYCRAPLAAGPASLLCPNGSPGSGTPMSTLIRAYQRANQSLRAHAKRLSTRQLILDGDATFADGCQPAQEAADLPSSDTHRQRSIHRTGRAATRRRQGQEDMEYLSEWGQERWQGRGHGRERGREHGREKAREGRGGPGC